MRNQHNQTNDERQSYKRLAAILVALHFAVDDASIFARAIDMMHLGQEALVRQDWIQNVITEDRQHVEKAFSARCRQRVTNFLASLLLLSFESKQDKLQQETTKMSENQDTQSKQNLRRVID